jgi:hypothetical protein
MDVMLTKPVIASPDGFLERNQRINFVSEEKAVWLKITPVLLECLVSMSTFAWRSRTIVNNIFAVRNVAFPPMLTMPRGVLVLTEEIITLRCCVLGGEGG